MKIDFVSNRLFPYRPAPGDLARVTATIRSDTPWLADIVEVLPTDAPSSAYAWCCYINTVIFYEQPWRVIRDYEGRQKGFAKHDEVKTLIYSDDILMLDGERFEMCGGKVCRRDDQWVMERKARRILPN